MAVPALVNMVQSAGYKQAASGNCFLAMPNVLAGLAIPAHDATAQTMVLWNKSTNKNLSLIDMTIAGQDDTANVGGCIGFSIAMAGTGLGTPISANVALASVYKLSDFSIGSSADWSWCTATFAAATIFLPVFQVGDYVLTEKTVMTACTRVWNGSLIIPPGVAFAVASNPTAQTALYNISITFEVVAV
jgi:hypothetical protein